MAQHVAPSKGMTLSALWNRSRSVAGITGSFISHQHIRVTSVRKIIPYAMEATGMHGTKPAMSDTSHSLDEEFSIVLVHLRNLPSALRSPAIANINCDETPKSLVCGENWSSARELNSCLRLAF